MLNLETLFPFQLDTFQKDAVQALNEGKSVVVCAPTGSGKTLIGEYAIYRALDTNRRVFYTTPLKALSNQKLRDFREQFGAKNVGLLTGDTAINRDAPVVVMTTEIFRNMLYGTRIGEVGTSLADVEAVVLDECHYMNDRQRGTVWEESIIYCPPEIQVVALSATVENGDQLTDWLCQVHGPTELIYSDFRPVPLDFHYCHSKGLFPLLDETGNKINPRLKQRRRQTSSRKGKKDGLSIPYVVGQLHQRDMLPAIYFIFSRRGCDRAVTGMGNVSLVNEQESAQLQQKIDEFLAWNPDAARAGQVEPLYRGIAAHHAGILPAWKGLVEELFQAGLIKVVFATETLAAGINMPARTTVISSLSKRTDSGHRLLMASEFLQMSGRAGRRGMDDLGHVVTIETPFEGAKEAAYLATVGPDPLVSQFTPSYGMVLNLLQRHTLEEARSLIERSFGQYLANLHLAPQQAAIDNLKAELEHVRAQVEAFDEAVFADYEKLRERLREEKRLLKTLQQQAAEVLQGDMGTALAFAIAGTTLSLKGKHVPVATPLPAVLVSKVPSSGHFPYLICLTQDNRWYVVATGDVVGLHAEYTRIAAVDDLVPPADMPHKPGQHRKGNAETATIACQIPQAPPLAEVAPEVKDQLDRMRLVEERIEEHPAREYGNPKRLLKQFRRIQRMQGEIRDREQTLSNSSDRYWQEFASIMAVLEHFGCLEDNQPSSLGETAAAIRGDNELWLGLALSSGQFDELTPPQLASACAALVMESARPDTWVDYHPSPVVDAALASLKRLRRELFQQQRRHNVMFPIWMEYELIGLVEEWVSMGQKAEMVAPEGFGVGKQGGDRSDWTTLCSNTSLDEGDIVRVLRRTLDFLSQIPHVPHISAQLQSNARQTCDWMNRFPVNENMS
ncbi:DEAD/DEAH box helicase [Oscillatoria sp. CS-180]|uniref:DEAD/DEAH box helicase n=1 Tax=Oscillatoria sp. CS-180 TaxID=3021720 RepID=UPI00232CB68D|nr:DEAD/DEAH box helicase [Oscillatoria sp. CS-180]MDB9528420.1 DEAD/DEAH box helicase [Oscillatoria sp. CS-180]